MLLIWENSPDMHIAARNNEDVEGAVRKWDDTFDMNESRGHGTTDIIVVGLL